MLSKPEAEACCELCTAVDLLHCSADAWQVHGSAEAADAARQPVAWGELVLLVWRVIKRPVMWLLVAIGVLWGEWGEV
jgi:hypothetical protein